jgi:DNA polymerase-4
MMTSDSLGSFWEQAYMDRTIIHVDMDAFYASIEQRDDPSIAGKPVIVGGVTGQRGVVSAASYEARRFGVHSAMPISRARRQCPEGIFLSGDMEKYSAVSKQLRAILSSYTPLVEPLSLDEAFLDVTASLRLWPRAETIGREIKQRVRDELNLTASVGIAPNKFLAKMASDHSKPDGLLVVKAGEEAEFLRDLPVREIFGVGKVTARRMTEQGVHTIGQLAERSRQGLRQAFGKQGERLYELARGIDDAEVVADTEAKSISHETTFDVDVGDERQLRTTIGLLSDRVSARLRQEELVGSTIGIKVRLADFTTLTREKSLEEPVDADNEILAIAWSLFEKTPLGGQKIRLLGVTASGLDRASDQISLFPETEEKSRKTMRAVDNIRKKFGDAAIGRASHTKPVRKQMGNKETLEKK